jgi:hypothetical protein
MQRYERALKNQLENSPWAIKEATNTDLIEDSQHVDNKREIACLQVRTGM